MNRGRYLPYVLLAPALALILTFEIYPVGEAFSLSLQRYDIYTQDFVGLSNFKDILFGEGAANFRHSMVISCIWVGGSVAIQFMIGLVLALVLHQSFKGRGFFRALMLCPWAISGVIISLIWSWMLHGQVGVVNDILMKLHVIHQPVGWLSRPWSAMASLIMANAWRGSAFFAVTLLAALQTVPDELYEAAGMDGAGRLAKFRYVTVPMIREMIIITTALRTIWTFNNVDLIYAMTRGGPGDSTQTLAAYIFNTFLNSLKFGYASALAVVLFFILLIFTVLYFRLTRFGEAS